MKVWRKRGRKPVVEGAVVPFIAPRDLQVGFSVDNYTAWLSLDEAAKLVNMWKSLAATVSTEDAKKFHLKF
jgi:hypothetical protein